jgi:predicted DNA-binding WGR domain protein
MKRYFINQEGEANKFWNVEIDDATYTVSFGKVGTQGRENSKSLIDAASCETEVAKLIADKTKKGYREIREGEAVPQKVATEYRPMDEDLFWEIIASFNWKKQGDDDAVMLPALKRLAALPITDIFTFENILAEKLYQLDGARYADACYPVKAFIGGKPYISVDDFLYCRCVIVINGREYYEHILHNPANWPVDSVFESVLYLASNAYERKTKGQDYPHIPEPSFETYSNLAGWGAA